MTGVIDLPAEVRPGPTKAEVRAIVLQKLDLSRSDHLVDVGAGSGAISVAAGQVADRVTAIERDPDRTAAVETNVDANEIDGTVEIRAGEAPDRLPDQADVMFIGGTKQFDEVLDEIEPMGVRRVVMTAARIQTAASAIDEFADRELLDECLSVQIGRGYDLASETGFRSDNPVFVIVGTTENAVKGPTLEDEP